MKISTAGSEEYHFLVGCVARQPLFCKCQDWSHQLSHLANGDGVLINEGRATTVPSQGPPWKPRPGGCQIDTCPPVTPVGSGGGGGGSGPQGPARESETVRARGEAGQDGAAVSQLLLSRALRPDFSAGSLPGPLLQGSACVTSLCLSPLPCVPLISFVLGTPRFRGFLTPSSTGVGLATLVCLRAEQK